MKYVVTILISIFVIGCNHEEKEVSSPTELTGTWTSNCHLEERDDGDRYRISVWEFGNSNVSYKEDHYSASDSGCTQITGNEVGELEYTIGNSITASDGVEVKILTLEEVGDNNTATLIYAIISDVLYSGVYNGEGSTSSLNYLAEYTLDMKLETTLKDGETTELTNFVRGEKYTNSEVADNTYNLVGNYIGGSEFFSNIVSFNSDGTGTIKFSENDISTITWSINGNGELVYVEKGTDGDQWTWTVTRLKQNINHLIQVITPVGQEDSADIAVIGSFVLDAGI